MRSRCSVWVDVRPLCILRDSEHKMKGICKDPSGAGKESLELSALDSVLDREEASSRFICCPDISLFE